MVGNGYAGHQNVNESNCDASVYSRACFFLDKRIDEVVIKELVA